MAYQLDSNNPLISIPQKKLDSVIQSIEKDHELSQKTKGLMIEAVTRYANSNIPVDYWYREMTDFTGDRGLLKKYEEITSDMQRSYGHGVRICFAGKHGTGKTMVACNVLKRAVEKGFSALYITLTDVVTLMASNNVDGKYQARQSLLTVDFLVIDEFDPRFMGSNNAADLYGRILEPTLRTRIQNTLPTILCTNSPNVLAGFSGSLQQSISSLMSLVKTVPVLGSDYRSKQGNK